MNRVTNDNVKKSYKKCIHYIIIGGFILLIGILLIYLGCKEDINDTKNITHLNDLIESSKEKENKKAYLDIEYLSPKVAVYDDTTDAYYFAYDGKYYYIVYLKEKKANDLLAKDLESHKEKITGITKEIPDDVKEIAIELYNEYFIEEEDEKLTLNTFYNIFGDIYLDTTKTYTGTASMYNALGFLTFILGFVISLIGIIVTIKFRKNLKKISDYDYAKLEKEMSDQDAFYYNKKNLYLTENYIILLDGKFKYYLYKDILWMHPFEQRYNGIRTNKAIKINTNDGKSYLIANIPINTKAEQALYDEIWNTIATKNPTIKLGYTKENIDYFKGILKEVKLSKKR